LVKVVYIVDVFTKCSMYRETTNNSLYNDMYIFTFNNIPETQNTITKMISESLPAI